MGSLQHLAFELFKRAAGVDALHVPYKGAPPMLPDIISGQVPIGVISALAALGPSKAGRIRTLAVTSAQRMPSAPGMAGARRDAARLQRRAQRVPRGARRHPDLRHRKIIDEHAGRARLGRGAGEFRAAGRDAGAGNPAQLAAQIGEETRRWAVLVKEAGIQVE